MYMKWIYGILIVICIGVAAHDVVINTPYSTLLAISGVIYTIFFVGELICDKIDNLYEKISNNSK